MAKNYKELNAAVKQAIKNLEHQFVISFIWLSFNPETTDELIDSYYDQYKSYKIDLGDESESSLNIKRVLEISKISNRNAERLKYKYLGRLTRSVVVEVTITIEEFLVERYCRENIHKHKFIDWIKAEEAMEKKEHKKLKKFLKIRNRIVHKRDEGDPEIQYPKIKSDIRKVLKILKKYE